MVDKDLAVCMSAKVNATNWIGIGFSGPTKPPKMGMNHSDIVVAHAPKKGSDVRRRSIQIRARLQACVNCARLQACVNPATPSPRAD